MSPPMNIEQQNNAVIDYEAWNEEEQGNEHNPILDGGQGEELENNNNHDQHNPAWDEIIENNNNPNDEEEDDEDYEQPEEQDIVDLVYDRIGLEIEELYDDWLERVDEIPNHRNLMGIVNGIYDAEELNRELDDDEIMIQDNIFSFEDWLRITMCIFYEQPRNTGIDNLVHEIGQHDNIVDELKENNYENLQILGIMFMIYKIENEMDVGNTVEEYLEAFDFYTRHVNLA